MSDYGGGSEGARAREIAYNRQKRGGKGLARAGRASGMGKNSSRSLEDLLYDLERQAIASEYSAGGGGGGGGGGVSGGSVNALRSFKESGNKTIGETYAGLKAALDQSAVNTEQNYAQGVQGIKQAYSGVAPALTDVNKQLATGIGQQVAGLGGAGQVLQQEINNQIQSEIAKSIQGTQAAGAGAAQGFETLGKGLGEAARTYAGVAPFEEQRTRSKFNSQIDLNIAEALAKMSGGGGGGGGGRSGGSSKAGKQQAKELRAYAKYLKSKAGKGEKAAKAQQKALKEALSQGGVEGVLARTQYEGKGDIGQMLVSVLKKAGDNKDLRNQLIRDNIKDYIYGPLETKTRIRYEDAPAMKRFIGKALTLGKYSGRKKITEQYQQRPIAKGAFGVPIGEAGKARVKYEQDLERYIIDLLKQYNKKKNVSLEDL